jgi:hypothetical protein
MLEHAGKVKTVQEWVEWVAQTRISIRSFSKYSRCQEAVQVAENFSEKVNRR